MKSSLFNANKFEQNDLGNDLDPAYFSANKWGEDSEWELEQGLHNRTHWGSIYHNMKELKKSVKIFFDVSIVDIYKLPIAFLY